MNWAKKLRLRTMRSIHSAILGAALVGTASLATAQTPSATAVKLPKQHYTRSASFDLPIVMDQAYRLTLTEIRLYIKTPTTGWKLQESVAPHSTRFNCKVMQDGEYWYTLATVDRSGRMTPADVNLEPPSQRVVVDSALPVIQAQQATSAEGDFCLRCSVIDANVDHASLKAHCKTDFGEIPLEELLNQPGVFRIKGTEPLRFPIVITTKDLAGNVATKEINVRELIGTTANQPAPANTVADVSQTAAKVAVKDPPLPPSRFDTPPQLPALPASPNDAPNTRVALPPPIDNQVVDKGPDAVDPIVNKVPLTPEAPKQGAVPTQLINTTRAAVEYRIDQLGLSGVGKVEIFMTPDHGQTWHSLGEDADKKSPAEISLPGDGIYGIRIIVSNGNGFGGRRPVRGDAPHCSIEVDTTAPFVQLRSEKVQASAGHVELRWNATDSNLGAEPVSLFYRTKTDGPWLSIARNLKNDGLYNWNFQRDAGGQFFFKIEVTDRAGNVSHDVSRQPVIIDVSEPRATVVGVSGNGAVTPRP